MCSDVACPFFFKGGDTVSAAVLMSTILVVGAIIGTLVPVGAFTDSGVDLGAVVSVGTMLFLSATLSAVSPDGAIVGAVDHCSNGFCTIFLFGAMLEEDHFCLSLDSTPGHFESVGATDHVVPERTYRLLGTVREGCGQPFG